MSLCRLVMSLCRFHVFMWFHVFAWFHVFVLLSDLRVVFDSWIIQRMIWESMLLISPGIAPMTFYFDHTALRVSFPTGAKCVCTLGVRMAVRHIFITSLLCLFLISMSSHADLWQLRRYDHDL